MVEKWWLLVLSFRIPTYGNPSWLRNPSTKNGHWKMLSKMMLGKMDTLENLWDIHGTYMEHLGNGNPWDFIILSNIFSIAMIKKKWWSWESPYLADFPLTGLQLNYSWLINQALWSRVNTTLPPTGVIYELMGLKTQLQLLDTHRGPP